MADEPKTITIKQNTAISFSVAMILMIAGALISATTIFVELRNQVTVNKIDNQNQAADINVLKNENTLVKVELAKVQSQLTAIESHLIDIKQVQQGR